MALSGEINSFIKEFVKDLSEDNAAVFAGAGMSKSAGFVDWKELLRDIADELDLKIEQEDDLISLAQYHVNKLKGAAKLSRKILEEFSEQAEPSLTHEILARLPVRTYWTTNYDTLVEDALKRAYKIPDVKHSVAQLNTTRPKRDAVVYKMHGDAHHPNDAVLYKEQYERYYRTHEAFVTALSGDLVSKTFLFIGFSFTDPNLDYVLSRLHTTTKRNHYCFVRREPIDPKDDDEVKAYKRRKQELRVDDLKRYGIQSLLIDNYEDVPAILQEIESRFLKKTVFISGSAEDFGDWGQQEAQEFIHTLSASLVKNNLRVVNGFGWGVGSAVINGALEAIYANPEKFSEDQLIMRPFPQVATKTADLKQLWEQYRQRMIGLTGVAIFVFGNKRDVEGKIIEASGVIREAEIAIERGCIIIPVGATGFAAQTVWKKISEKPVLFQGVEWMLPLIEEICDTQIKHKEIVSKIIAILNRLGR
ncbi:SIR2 family protein [Pseudomonas sp. MWU12-2345]|uniref:SIR2 family protein n=1 Tax=Pseudomonas sp. MWU12-2345 TaxID=2928689 RepID=UPI00200E4FF5|nr:SIR2 family protein [Pseudomonas sp. MWU12-2345]